MSAFNKIIQKHVPQRLDVIGNSAQFSIRTGLLEILPDECMVGLECCFMQDPLPPNFNQVIYEEIDWAISSPIGLSQTRLLPSTTLSVDQGLIKVENLFNQGGIGAHLSYVAVQTKQKSQSVFSTLNKYVVSRFSWTFDYFTFNSCSSSPTVSGLITPNTINNDGNVHLTWKIGPIGYSLLYNWFFIGVSTLQDTSQSIILQNILNTEVLSVGQYIQLTPIDVENTKYIAYYKIQEVIDFNTIRITLGFQDIPILGLPISDTFFVGTQCSIAPLSFLFTISENGSSCLISQGNQVQINQYSDGSFEYLLPDGTTQPSNFVSFENFYMKENITQDCNTRMNIQSFTPVPSVNNSVLNINIESPLFTSARTYDTFTSAYSQNIASLPVGSDYSVSYREPVNNRNCSMYQINKNILNNFDIPFTITQNDGQTIYKVQNPDTFFIKFTLWFYAQTDDERYFYIPSL